MKFGETEYSLREFGGAILLRDYAAKRLSLHLDVLRNTQRHKVAVENTDGWGEEEKASKLEKASNEMITAKEGMAFYQWIIEQVNANIELHIERLREIYAKTERGMGYEERKNEGNQRTGAH